MTSASLLIAYDGSVDADAAIRAAGALFPGGRAVVVTVRREPITFEHAVDAALLATSQEVLARGVAALNDAAEREAQETAAGGARVAAEAGLAAEPKVAVAISPWRGLRRAADEIEADIAVCGSRGMGAFSRAVVGSTSSALLHRAGRPVLVVPSGAGDLDGPLIAGYDGSEPSRAGIACAGHLFDGREVIVVNVWESAIRHSLSGRAIASLPNEEVREIAGDVDAYFREVAQGVAAEGAAIARELGLQARAEAVEASGAAWRGLLATARAVSASAVIAGSRGRGAMASTVLGSVTSGLVHNADLPVLVVPPREG